MDSDEFLLDRGFDTLTKLNRVHGKPVYLVDVMEEYTKMVLQSKFNNVDLAIVRLSTD